MDDLDNPSSKDSGLTNDAADTVAAGSTTPETPVIDQQRLTDVLANLQVQFSLTNEQMAALPALSEVTLIPQLDSHRIRNTAGFRRAHPFKLFFGEMGWKMEGKTGRDAAYVYLFEGRQGKYSKMEICSADADGHWTPLDIQYFGHVTHMAYPFNEWLSVGRCVAAIKFYFLLGREVGLYEKEVGFKFSESWAKDLRGACDDLIEANGREEIEEDSADADERALDKQPLSSSATAARKGEKKARAPPNRARPQARRDEFPRVKDARKPVAMNNDSSDEQGWTQRPPGPGYYAPYFPPPLPGYAPPPHTYYPPLLQFAAPPPPGYPLPNSYYPPPPQFTTPPQFPTPPPGYPGRLPPQELYQALTTNQQSRGRMPEPAHSSPPRLKPHREESIRFDERAVRSLQTEQTSLVKTNELAALEEEFTDLYRRRERIQIRMNDIRSKMSEEEYRALVVKIEGSQLATLKRA